MFPLSGNNASEWNATRRFFVRIDVTDVSGLAPWLVEIGLPQVDRAPIMALGVPPVSAPGTMLVALSNQSLG